MNKILLKTEMNLIKKSTICDQDINMRRVLEKFPNGIGKKELKLIKENFGDIYDKIAPAELRKMLIENSALEWKQGKYIGKKEVPCELCGNLFSEKKFIINNKINGNKMLVGSTCIEKFENIDKEIKGEKLNNVANFNNKTYNRLIKFNKRYPRGKLEIDDMKNIYNSYNVSFPKDFDKEFERIIKGATSYYNNFKNGKISEDTLENFQSYKDDFDYLNKKCKKFIDKNMNNKFVCTKKIEKELIEKKLIETLSDIKSEDSILKPWHLKYISDTDFIKQFINEIESFVKLNDFELLNIKNKKIILQSNNINFDDLKFELNTEKFMYKFHNVISEKHYYKSNDLLEYSEILRERTNIFKYIDLISTVLIRYKYYLKMSYEMYDSGYLEIYRGNKFATVEIKNILNDKNLFILNINADAINQYMDKLEWKDKSDKEKFDIGNIGKVKSGGDFI